ncbi:GNAT family N-acetyltransferase [Roseibium sediminis]|uniref:GNAT family N-acetyltransferase n=1 Tax=Roseibium sediminis TaxID=1775174 RepID=UPI00123E23E5|nr:GNAT family N-acetyltransferase [Roseibium sediminis]
MSIQKLEIPSLQGDRIILRAPQPADFGAVEAFFADPKASRFYGGPLSRLQAWRSFAAQIGHWALRGYGVWMIEEKQSGQALGACGFYWPEGWPRRELTWWLLPEARGKGIASEASCLAIRHAYDVYRWDLVETHMKDENEAARALVHRLGGELMARERFPDGFARNVYRLPNGN